MQTRIFFPLPWHKNHYSSFSYFINIFILSFCPSSKILTFNFSFKFLPFFYFLNLTPIYTVSVSSLTIFFSPRLSLPPSSLFLLFFSCFQLFQSPSSHLLKMYYLMIFFFKSHPSIIKILFNQFSIHFLSIFIHLHYPF